MTRISNSKLKTDEAQFDRKPGKAFAAHEAVNHRDAEYAHGETATNTVEGFFGIFKRRMRGLYHPCGEQHLQAYLNEPDLRYSNRVALDVDDAERSLCAINHQPRPPREA